MISAFRLASLCSAALLMACGDKSITAPNCDRCDEMRVVTDRPEYRPGSTIAFTITNRTPANLRYDWCSVALASRTSTDVDFDVRYQPSRRCGFGAGPAEVLASKQVLPFGVAVDATHVYWCNSAQAGAVLRVGLGGGSPTIVAGGQEVPIFIALDGAAGTRVRRLHFPGDRERVRYQAAQAALEMLRRGLLDLAAL